MNPFEPTHTKFYRDSRHAFGHRFYVEQPNPDMKWAVFFGIVLAIVAMVLL